MKFIPLTIALLLLSPVAWAYRPLEGIILPLGDNPPVIVEQISSSLQDTDLGRSLVWDTTLTLKNTSAKPIRAFEVEVIMTDIQGKVITRLIRPFVVPIEPQAQTTQQLSQLHLAWPGSATAVRVKTVTFADETRWELPTP